MVLMRVMSVLQATVHVDVRICRTSGGASIFRAGEIKYICPFGLYKR